MYTTYTHYIFPYYTLLCLYFNYIFHTTLLIHLLKYYTLYTGKKYDNPAHQSQRKMKIKQLESLIEIEEVEEDSTTTLKLPKPYCIFNNNDILIRIENLSFKWQGETQPLFTNVEYSISPSSRIVIVGKNGCGKSNVSVCL